jgi:putative transposase
VTGAALEGGPAVWGRAEDQRWTLARVTALTGRLFHVRYTLRGTSYVLHRIGFTPQVPVRRAVERDEAKIAAWRAVTRRRCDASGGERSVDLLLGYAPDLNPAEGAWANMKNGLGNLAVRNADQLAAVVKNRLKRIQYRPGLIGGFLAQTGLALEPGPP